MYLSKTGIKTDLKDFKKLSALRTEDCGCGKLLIYVQLQSKNNKKILFIFQ
uniref:Uncharacterized protein n=1 Tax=Meloidogyne enterolobii TaxID=390850 RepID=A0A6V7V2H9_MELEN|nr:unnamed protein product [Meloidogyne enterolobii]